MPDTVGDRRDYDTEMTRDAADDARWFGHADARRPAVVGVIAEIGVNHDGEADRAESLIRAAAWAGADAVKFQVFHPDRLLSGAARLADYQVGRAKDAAALLRRLALPLDVLLALRKVVRDCGMRLVATPFSLGDVDQLAKLEVDAVKIASPDAVNRPLLEAAAALGRPMLISTGTCDLDELDFAARIVARSDESKAAAPNGGGGGALLQCVSAYPTPDPAAALGGIAALRERFGRCTGYSDHTTAEDTGGLAVAAGACLLEKHLTHDRTAAGPDHAASIEPAGLQRYIQLARRAAAMLGPIAKSCGDLEGDVKTASRQSVCSSRALSAGRTLTADDLVVKRPGTGLPAAELDRLVGRTLGRDVPGDQPLQAEDLAH